MYSVSGDWRKSDMSGYARKVIRGSSGIAQGLATRLKKSHPEIVSDAGVAANKWVGQGKRRLAPNADAIKYATLAFSKEARRYQWWLVLAGCGYALFKCFHTPKNMNLSPAGKLKARIHQKPLQSSLIALGIGLLIGRVVL